MDYSQNIIKSASREFRARTINADLAFLLKTAFIFLVLSSSLLYAQQTSSLSEDPIAEKITQLEKWASTGNTTAPYDLAILYIEGLQVEQDYRKAFKWMRTSAEYGHITAQYNLGLMYLEGIGTKRNPKKAFQTMKNAAYQGSLEAQYCLAWMYQTGIGVKQDRAEATDWYLWLGESGLDWHRFALIIFYYYGSSQESLPTKVNLWRAYVNCILAQQDDNDVTLLRQIIGSKMDKELMQEAEQYADIILKSKQPVFSLAKAVKRILSIGPKDFLPMEDAIVFGYDTSRPASQTTASSEIPVQQLKGWILGCSGVLWESNRNDFITLAGDEITGINIQTQKELLSEWWGIESREDLLQDLYWLSQEGGHRDNFARDGVWASRMTSDELERLLEPHKDNVERCNDLRIANQYYALLGDKGILGWDLTRYICLCRWGYLCGFIDEKTAWELMIPIARQIQQTFSSWEEFGQNYLIGRQYWSYKHTQNGGDIYQEAFWRLTEMPSSPWNLYPWDLNLNAAYEQICDPLQSDSFASIPPSETDGSLYNKKLISMIDNLQRPVPELSEPNLTHINILAELQKNGPVLIVPDQYETIQAAVDAANEGDTVFIKNGVYNGKIMIMNKKHLALVGESAKQVTFNGIDPEIDVILHVENSDGIEISDLSIIQSQNDTSKLRTCIGAKNANMKIVRCLITNEQGFGIQWYSYSSGTIQDAFVRGCADYGVSVSEDATYLEISKCCFQKNLGGGVVIYRGAKAEIDQTTFMNNETGVFISQPGTDVTLSDCHFIENNGNGVTLSQEAKVKINTCMLRANGKSGIYLTDPGTTIECRRIQSENNQLMGMFLENSASAQLRECIFSGNMKSGILVYKSAKANVSYCASLGNKQSGFEYRKSANGIIDNCVSQSNTLNGIYIREKDSEVTVKDNLNFENEKAGIRIYDGAFAELQNNTCFYNKLNGIEVYHNNASANLQNNRCSHNQQCGISFSGGATGTIDGNICINNKMDGIVVYEKSRVEIANNKCSQNSKTGINVHGGGSAELTGNICQRNGNHGILLYKKTTGVIKNCQIEDNAWTGIAISGRGTQVDLINNYCRGNKYNGIRVSGGAGPKLTLTQNTCLDNYPAGIFIDGESAGQLQSNVCKENPWAGIAIKGEGTNPVLNENDFSDNGTWGILIWAGAKPDIKDNTIENNGVDGLMIREDETQTTMEYSQLEKK